MDPAVGLISVAESFSSCGPPTVPALPSRTLTRTCVPPLREPLPASVERWLGLWIANVASAPIRGAARFRKIAAWLRRMSDQVVEADAFEERGQQIKRDA